MNMISYLVIWSPCGFATVDKIKAIDAFAVDKGKGAGRAAADYVRRNMARYLEEHGEGKVELVPHVSSRVFYL